MQKHPIKRKHDGGFKQVQLEDQPSKKHRHESTGQLTLLSHKILLSLAILLRAEVTSCNGSILNFEEDLEIKTEIEGSYFIDNSKQCIATDILKYILYILEGY